MNNKWLVLAVVVQISVLVFMAGKREVILSQGETIFLKTSPVDPRDIFRGDYVTLSYDIAALDKSTMDEFRAQHPAAAEDLKSQHKQIIAYLSLERGVDGIAKPQRLTQTQPAQGLFIKARIGRGTFSRWQSGNRLKFGIEKYFVEQGKGREMEAQLGARDDWQRPMEVEVALGGDGTAVIKGYRWSDLAVRLEVLEEAIAVNNRDASLATTQRRSAAIKFSLRNDSDREITLPVGEGPACEFKLLGETQQWRAEAMGRHEVVFVNRICSAYHAGSYAKQVLKPGEQFSVPIDFSKPEWHIKHDGKIDEIGNQNLPWVYRLVYQPPTNLSAANSSSNASLWRSQMKSPQFSIAGRVD